MRIAALWCEDAPRWSGYQESLYRSFFTPGDTLTIFHCCRGEIPDVATALKFDAMIIGGSRYSVVEDGTNPLPDWVVRLKALILHLYGCLLDPEASPQATPPPCHHASPFMISVSGEVNEAVRGCDMALHHDILSQIDEMMASPSVFQRLPPPRTRRNNDFTGAEASAPPSPSPYLFRKVPILPPPSPALDLGLSPQRLPRPAFSLSFSPNVSSPLLGAQAHGILFWSPADNSGAWGPRRSQLRPPLPLWRPAHPTPPSVRVCVVPYSRVC